MAIGKQFLHYIIQMLTINTINKQLNKDVQRINREISKLDKRLIRIETIISLLTKRTQLFPAD